MYAHAELVPLLCLLDLSSQHTEQFISSLLLFLPFFQVEAEQKVAIMGERVKIAEEQAHSLTKKKLETEEEIRRVRASAVRVCTCTSCVYVCVWI